MLRREIFAIKNPPLATLASGSKLRRFSHLSLEPIHSGNFTRSWLFRNSHHVFLAPLYKYSGRDIALPPGIGSGVSVSKMLKLCVKFFYVMGKGPSVELSCTWTGLVTCDAVMALCSGNVTRTRARGYKTFFRAQLS